MYLPISSLLFLPLVLGLPVTQPSKDIVLRATPPSLSDLVGTPLVNGITGLGTELSNDVSGTASKGVDATSGAFTKVSNDLSGGLTEVVNGANNAVTLTVNAVSSTLSGKDGAVNAVKDIGSNLTIQKLPAKE